jgi:hypothetical protein
MGVGAARKPPTLPLPVPLKTCAGVKARREPRTVPPVRIPLDFCAISMTCWRCRESRANPSLPISLLNREKTGNFCESRPNQVLARGVIP